MKTLISESLKKAIPYNEYRSLFQEYVQKRKTSGEIQSESLINYTKLNWSRSLRVEKNFPVTPEAINHINSVNSPITFLIITEMWCGDAAQVLPMINKMAEINNLIKVKVIFRDEYPELINNFLTNGGKSIPKVLIIDHKINKVLADWGPRPSYAQKMVLDYKSADEKISFDEFATSLQKWYNQDKGISIQNEFNSQLIKGISKIVI